MLANNINRYVLYLKDKESPNKDRNERILDLTEQKLAAEVALKELQGELHELKRDIEMGKFIDAKQVELDYATFFVVFKKFALSIPNRVVGQLRGSLDPLEARAVERQINDEITDMLRDFVVAAEEKS